MKKVLVVMAVLCGLVSFAPAAEMGGQEVGIDVSLDYFCKYIWRGQVLNNDGVLQPGLELSFPTTS